MACGCVCMCVFLNGAVRLLPFHSGPAQLAGSGRLWEAACGGSPGLSRRPAGLPRGVAFLAWKEASCLCLWHKVMPLLMSMA